MFFVRFVLPRGSFCLPSRGLGAGAGDQFWEGDQFGTILGPFWDHFRNNYFVYLFIYIYIYIYICFCIFIY